MRFTAFKLILLLCLTLGSIIAGYGQQGNLTNQNSGLGLSGLGGAAISFLSDSYVEMLVQDQEKMMVAYLRPVSVSMASSTPLMGSIPVGDSCLKLTVGANVGTIFIPYSSRTYDVTEIELKHLKPSSSKRTLAQTVYGNSSSIEIETIAFIPEITNVFPYFSNTPLASFESIPGLNKYVIALPSVALGLEWKNTRFTVGGMYANGQARFVNLRTGVDQLIKINAAKQISLMTGLSYSYFQTKIDLDILPETTLDYNPDDYDNQFVNLATHSVPIKAIFIIQKEKYHLGIGGSFFMAQNGIDIVGKYAFAIGDPQLDEDITLLNVNDPVSHLGTYVMAQGIATSGYQTEKFGINLNLGIGKMYQLGVQLYYRLN